MKDDLAKMYAAFRSGCLGNNILDAYFPFFVNIICEENWDIVDEVKVAECFEKKYHIPVPLTFVRQVLGVGMRNNSINYDHGKYRVQKDIISQYGFDSSVFDKKWTRLLEEFMSFCAAKKYDISAIDIEIRILKWIEINDETVISKDDLTAPENSDVFDYSWNKFLTEKASTDSELFEFVASLSFSNIMKQAVFYSGDGTGSFRGLNVYLDSPMIFALLGMDSTSRVSSCEYLLEKMKASGCLVQIFDHNFQEIDGIISRAAGWAISNQYDISKANNAVRYFHDSQMDEHDIAEYCESLEDKLAQMNITIKKTDYDIYGSSFQEDEKILYEMIENKYTAQSITISEEKKHSIIIDVRSIIMVYRARKGQTATRIQSSRDIMLTLNGTVANVSKDYESSRSINSGHIPACVSADLFGTVMWLFSPAELLEYQRKQLLADCYNALRPTKKLLDKYMESLSMARAAGEIDEKTFLFMRSHAVVNDALMNVTKGDYARFNERTYLEVYDEIQEIAEKKYEDEVQAHNNTRNELSSLLEMRQVDQKKIDVLTDDVNELKAQLSTRDKAEFDKKCRKYGWLFTLLLFGAPYIIVLVTIEIIKSLFTSCSWYSLIMIATLVIVTIVVGVLFQKVKQKCFTKVEKHFKEKIKERERQTR